MPWEYSQSTGRLRLNGQVVGTGYSGAGLTSTTGRNNSSMQSVANAGPIPQGQWTIGAPISHATKGPMVMRLTPVGHTALGRSGFLIHGNNAANNASEGCIILGPALRLQIAQSGDTALSVVP
jgi:hypothetical protein